MPATLDVVADTLFSGINLAALQERGLRQEVAVRLARVASHLRHNEKGRETEAAAYEAFGALLMDDFCCAAIRRNLGGIVGQLEQQIVDAGGDPLETNVERDERIRRELAEAERRAREGGQS